MLCSIIFCIAIKLYCKYIVNNANLQINISYRVRNDITEQFYSYYMNNKVNNALTNEEKLYFESLKNSKHHFQILENKSIFQHNNNINVNFEKNIFDFAAKEIFELLSDSFTRFRRTDDYKKLSNY